MFIKKGIILVSVAATLFLGITGCGNNKNAALIDNPDEGTSVIKPTEFINSGGGMMVNKTEWFANVAELKESAEEIVHLKALSSETIEYGELPFTITNAEVLNVIEGNLSKGDIIKLVQTGGIVDGEERSIMGDPIYRPDEEMVLFIKKCKVPYAEDTYRSLGINDGRFDVKNSRIIARGLGYNDETASKEKKQVKRSDSIAEMGFNDITHFCFTAEEFGEKIKELAD